MYTTKPDEGCREVSPGIYGRPVHTSHQSGLRKQGWVYSINDIEVTHVRKEKEGRQESEEMNQFEADQEYGYLCEKYQEKFGKLPHHKMKAETIRKKLDESDD